MPAQQHAWRTTALHSYVRRAGPVHSRALHWLHCPPRRPTPTMANSVTAARTNSPMMPYWTPRSSAACSQSLLRPSLLMFTPAGQEGVRPCWLTRHVPDRHVRGRQRTRPTGDPRALNLPRQVNLTYDVCQKPGKVESSEHDRQHWEAICKGCSPFKISWSLWLFRQQQKDVCLPEDVRHLRPNACRPGMGHYIRVVRATRQPKYGDKFYGQADEAKIVENYRRCQGYLILGISIIGVRCCA